MIKNKNELKQWHNILHVAVDTKSIVQRLIQIKNGIIKHVNMNFKIYGRCKKD